MKRLILAVAGYALYRWWTSQETQPVAAREPAPRRKPEQPVS
jgi:hypothetical protein